MHHALDSEVNPSHSFESYPAASETNVKRAHKLLRTPPSPADSRLCRIIERATINLELALTLGVRFSPIDRLRNRSFIPPSHARRRSCL